MPTLILSPRYTEDSRTIREAALARGWRVLRLPGWRAPEDAILRWSSKWCVRRRSRARD